MPTCEGNELRVLFGNVYEGRDVACGSLRFFWCCVFCAFSGSLAGFPRGQTPELSLRGRSRILPPSVGVGLCVCVCVCVCVSVCVCVCVVVSGFSARRAPSQGHERGCPIRYTRFLGGLDVTNRGAGEGVRILFSVLRVNERGVFRPLWFFACAARPCGR